MLSSGLSLILTKIQKLFSDFSTKVSKRLFVVFIAFLVIISPFVIYLILQFNNDARSRAGLEEPQRIMVGNVAIDSFTVVWITPDKSTSGFISVGESADKIDRVVLDERDKSGTSQRKTHIAVVRGLAPGKKYYYRITSGATVFPKVGTEPLTFTTPSISSQRIPQVLNIFGEIESITTDDAIVYLTILDRATEVFPLITFPSSDRTWFHNADLIYERSLTERASLTSTTNLQVILDTGEKTAVVTTSTSKSPIKLTPGDQNIAILPIFTGKKVSPTVVATTAATTPIATVAITPSINITQTPNPTPTPTINAPRALVSIIIDFFKLRQDVPLKRNDGTVVDNLPSDDLLRALRTQGFITNVTENSFTVVWNTIQIIPGNIDYGTTTNLGTILNDDRVTIDSQPSTSLHYVTIKNLTPETKYYFRKNSSATVESFTLPKTLSSPPAFNNITGVIEGGKGECFIKADVTRGTSVSTPISVIVDPNLSWNINLGTIRNKEFTSYFSPVNSDSLTVEALCITNESKLLRGTLTNTVENITKDPELKISVK